MHTLELTDAELKMISETLAQATAPAAHARTLANLYDKVKALVDAALKE